MFRVGALQIEYGTMLVQVVVFLVLLWLVLRYAMKPAMKVLNERQNYISSQITGAEEANKEAARLADEQRRILTEARKDAQGVLEQARQQKEREGEQIIKDAQERAERLIKDAIAEIAVEKNRAISELRDQVGTLSIQLASKIIEKEMDANNNSVLIDDFLKQVGGRV
ncbi:MAG: atpF [Cohnella sp.]|nr:atpF [Cohnella sp.]